MRKICLFDLDQTLCDHNGALARDLAKIMSPNDPVVFDEEEPDWLKERIKLVRGQRDWWLNLNPLPLGIALYNIARVIGFEIMILSKGPYTCDYAWTEKVQWVKRHLHDDVKKHLCEDKGLVYGTVLVDDYKPYIESWLQWRPRGLVIQPLHDKNKPFVHPQIVPYDGNNLDEVHARMKEAYQR